MNPFKFIDIVGYSKDESDLTSELIRQEYQPFIINRSLSYHADSLIYANEMNQRHFLSEDLQFQFYLNSLRPRKRFAKWAKAEKVDNLEAVKIAFNYNNEKALQIIDLLSDEQIDEIVKDRTGGVEK